MDDAKLLPRIRAQEDALAIERVDPPGLVSLKLWRAHAVDIQAISCAINIDLALDQNRFGGARCDALRLGPDEWLLRGAPSVESLSAGLADVTHQALDVTAACAYWRIEGKHAAELIACGCSLDLDARIFVPGSGARTLIAQVTAIVMRPTSAPLFEVLVDTSVADYFASWLADAALGVVREPPLPTEAFTHGR